MTDFNTSKLKEFADKNFEFDDHGLKFAEGVENTVGKGEIACSPFPTKFSEDLYQKHVKTWAFLGKD